MRSRHGQRLLLVVGDEDQGDAELLLQLLQLELHLLAQLAVERAERLVAQAAPRGSITMRAGQRDALLLAAGELAGRRSSSPVSSTWRQRLRLRGARSRCLRHPRMRRPKATFSATVRCGNSA